jgi:hypothetical protein
LVSVEKVESELGRTLSSASKKEMVVSGWVILSSLGFLFHRKTWIELQIVSLGINMILHIGGVFLDKEEL